MHLHSTGGSLPLIILLLEFLVAALVLLRCGSCQALGCLFTPAETAWATAAAGGAKMLLTMDRGLCHEVQNWVRRRGTHEWGCR